MSNIAKNVLDAAEIIAEQKAALMKYDKTIVATVIAVTSIELGQYKVKYQDGTFLAYAAGSDTYKKGDQVLVLIPESDFGKIKTILQLAKYNTTLKKDHGGSVDSQYNHLIDILTIKKNTKLIMNTSMSDSDAYTKDEGKLQEYHYLSEIEKYNKINDDEIISTYKNKAYFDIKPLKNLKDQLEVSSTMSLAFGLTGLITTQIANAVDESSYDFIVYIQVGNLIKFYQLVITGGAPNRLSNFPVKSYFELDDEMRQAILDADEIKYTVIGKVSKYTANPDVKNNIVFANVKFSLYSFVSQISTRAASPVILCDPGKSYQDNDTITFTATFANISSDMLSGYEFTWYILPPGQVDMFASGNVNTLTKEITKDDKEENKYLLTKVEYNKIIDCNEKDLFREYKYMVDEGAEYSYNCINATGYYAIGLGVKIHDTATGSDMYAAIEVEASKKADRTFNACYSFVTSVENEGEASYRYTTPITGNTYTIESSSALNSVIQTNVFSDESAYGVVNNKIPNRDTNPLPYGDEYYYIKWRFEYSTFSNQVYYRYALENTSDNGTNFYAYIYNLKEQSNIPNGNQDWPYQIIKFTVNKDISTSDDSPTSPSISLDTDVIDIDIMIVNGQIRNQVKRNGEIIKNYDED